MLVKLRQLECVRGFKYFMYSLLEMLGKVMEFMWPSRSADWENSQQLLPVRALNLPLGRLPYRRRRATWELSRTGHAHHLNPAQPHSHRAHTRS